MASRKSQGFSLIELAIVITIVAVITGMGLVATVGALESARRAATENKLNAIEDALMAFRIANDRLPCPAGQTVASTVVATYGVATTPPGDCTAAEDINPDAPGPSYATIMEGSVPVVTLGLPLDFILDGWGRRITYRVMKSYTDLNAFSIMHPKEQCGMNVLPSVASGVVKSDNTLYSLVSHGANGHGGYLPNGQIVSANSVNVDEQSNCRCSATATVGTFNAIVQKNYTDDPTDARNIFDDIVRYKERWQMMSADDDLNFGAYNPIQLVMGYSNATGGTIGAGMLRRRCDNYLKRVSEVAGGWISTAAVDKKVKFASFTPDNKYIFLYSSTQTCELLRITSGVVGTTNLWPATAGCPVYNAGITGAMSDNGYLILSDNVAPFLRIWQYSNDTFVSIPFSPTSPLVEIPFTTAISKNADKIGVFSGSDRFIYSRRANNDLTTHSVSIPLSGKTINYTKFSDDGKFLAVLVGGCPETLRIFQFNISGGYTELGGDCILRDKDNASLKTGLAGNIKMFAFSPDGQYLALATTVMGTTISENFKIYKIDENSAGTIIFTPTTIVKDYGDYSTSVGTSVVDLKFSADSSYLFAIDNGTVEGAFHSFKKTGTLTFRYTGATDIVATDGAVTAIPSFLAVAN